METEVRKMDDNGVTIQIRYCFNDENLHSMNAEVFNECERQFIKAVKGLEKYLEDRISIDIKPREEGSLIDTFNIIINNSAGDFTIPPFFTVLITAAVTTFFNAKFPSARHKTDETSKKLENFMKIKEEIKRGNLTETNFDYITSTDKDLQKQKSNFFKSAKKEEKLIKLEAKTVSNSIQQPVVILVDRKNFDDFIIPEITEKIEEVQQAKIYIVAPILVKGRKDSWKGMYENDSIEFKITDKEFLEQVWSQLIKFRNGTFINCDLKVVKTTNTETGEIKIFREVTHVVNYSDDDKQIKSIIHKKEIKKHNMIQQLKMFD